MDIGKCKKPIISNKYSIKQGKVLFKSEYTEKELLNSLIARHNAE